MKQRNIVVTSTDLARLQAVINSARQDSRVPLQLLNALEDELRRAEVVEPGELPGDVVSMESTIWFRDEADGDEECYMLVYPQQADVSRNRISVIAPIGTALLGYRIGDVVEWEVPAGISRLKITGVAHRSSSKNAEECAA
jgi:regulator of nucleoside diphosphate kinase